MAFQDILPITSISLVIFGFLTILFGFIWLANTISNEETNTSFTNAEDIIGEMNQMFAYFTNRIDRKEETYHIQNQHYAEVIGHRKQGKTPDQIAKELNIGKGEVNLILGIDQMR